MTNARLLRFLGGRRKTRIEAAELHLISAYDLLQAQAEALTMASPRAEEAGLCLNACILAKAAKKNGKRIFENGEAVLRAMPAERIEQWTKRYLEVCEQENLSCGSDEREQIKQALAESSYERLKWRVLRAFGVLPSEQRARRMTDGDYLYCVMQMMLDEEERLERLCSACRERLHEPRCECCGAPLEEENTAFDEKRYEELRRGEVHRTAAAKTSADGGEN